MSEGQHKLQVVLHARARDATKEFRDFRQENARLTKENERLSSALAKAGQVLQGQTSQTERLTRAQREAAKATQAQARAEERANGAKAQRVVDQARRAREQVEATGKASVDQRLAAIKREEVARQQQVQVELRAAKTVADVERLRNRQQQISHEAYLARSKVQREEASRTAEAQMLAAKRAERVAREEAARTAEAQVLAARKAQRAQAEALAASQRSQGALAAQRRAVSARGGMSTVSAVAGGAGIAAGGVAAAGMAASEVADLADESLRLQGVFNNLPYSLNAARAATRGFADDATLAALSVQAEQTHVADTAQKFADLAGKAQILALKVGRDVPETITRIVQGMAKQERELFDELGLIIPHQDEINRKLAESLGVTTKELTEQQRAAGFNAEVMKALTKATQGVAVDMDGAAASIARTTVRVKNLRTSVLGGVEAEASLAEGVRRVDVEVLRNLDTITTYRSNFYELVAALDDAGVNTSKYANNARGLQRDVEKLLKSEAARLSNLALEGKLTNEHMEAIDRLRAAEGALSGVQVEILRRDMKRLDLENERERAAARAARAAKAAKEDELRYVEEQIAYGQGAQIDQEQLNALVQEEYRLKIELLELEGDLEKATELRREAELAALRTQGASGVKRGRGGGRSRKDAARELAEAEADARIAEAERAAASVQRSLDREQASYLELLGAVLAVHDAELARAELELVNAKTKADRVRAEMALADLQAEQDAELVDLTLAAAEAEHRRAAAIQETVKAEHARAQAALQRQHELLAVSPSRAAAPGRPTLLQGLGLDVGPMSQVDGQAKLDMDNEHARAAELRALRLQQLEQERAYEQARLQNETTRVEATAELRRLEDEEAQLLHQAQLERLQARQWAEDEALRREQERVATRRQLSQQAAQWTLQQGETAIKTAISIAKNEREARRSAMAAARAEGKTQAEIEKAGADAAKRSRGESLMALGEQLQGEAISYAVKAAAAGVALNPVGAATNAAAGTIIAAGGAAVKARARTLLAAGGGGGGGEGDTGGAPSMGAGVSANPIPPSQDPNNPNARDPTRGPPEAANPAGSGDGRRGGTTSAPAGGRTIIVNINAPLVAVETVEQIREIMERLEAEE